MTDFTYTRLGQANLSGSTEKLFRDKFIPYFLTQFDEERVVAKNVYNKTITSGKSASFPVFSKLGAKYFQIGDRAVGNQKLGKNEVTIFVDPLLVSDVVLYDIDEKMSETKDREIIATEMARALANTEDKQLLQVGVLASRANANIVNGNAGSVIKTKNIDTDAALLAAGIYAAGVKLDEKNVPAKGRMCYVRPLQYSLLCQYENIADKNIGGGDYAKGTTGLLDDIQIIKTNHLPKTNILEESDGAKPNNIYYGDFSGTVALIMTPAAIGTVTLHNVITELSWNPEYFHHLFTARVSQGHGILRPECAVELSSAVDETEPTTATEPTSATEPTDPTEPEG